MKNWKKVIVMMMVIVLTCLSPMSALANNTMEETPEVIMDEMEVTNDANLISEVEETAVELETTEVQSELEPETTEDLEEEKDVVDEVGLEEVTEEALTQEVEEIVLSEEEEETATSEDTQSEEEVEATSPIQVEENIQLEEITENKPLEDKIESERLQSELSIVPVMLMTDEFSTLDNPVETNTFNFMVLQTEQDITKVQVLKTEDGTEFAMFVVSEWTAKLNKEGQVDISITTNNVSYDKLYFGSKDDTEKSPVIQGTETANGGWSFSFSVPAEQRGTSQPIVLGKPDGSWYVKKDLVLTIPTNVETTQEPENPSENNPTPTPDTDTLSNGKYTVTVETGAAMFKVIAAILTVKDGQMTAEITLSGDGQDNLYMGTAAEAAAAESSKWIAGTLVTVDGENRYKFTIPVSALDEVIVLASQSARNDKWYDRTVTFDSSTLEKYVFIPEDGTYTATAETGAAMFKVITTVLTVKDGKMTAEITLSGSGQDNLYMGTAAEADAAGSGKWIAGEKVTVDGKDRYKFTIPVAALDEAIVLASQSASNDKWFDRTITIDSSTLKATSTSTHPETGTVTTPTTQPEEELNTGVTDDETIQDMIENTKPGEVKDGTYKPSFGYKGGTGRVTISCSQVVVKNGKATATIVFSSSNYTYAKVNGTKYYNQNKGGSSTFVIPVNLNGTTRIAAETTGMGTPYEIEYTLYVYVDGTNVSNIKSDVTYDDDTDSKDDKDKTEEELTEEEAAEEEENSWGAFNSEQTAETEGAVEEDTAETLAEAADGAEAEATEAANQVSVIPWIVIILLVIAAGAAYVVIKKRNQ